MAALEKQLRIPVPTKIGAVVRTSEGVFVLADPVDARSWYLPGSTSDDWKLPGEIGRVTEVLSEGVDL
ncbi:MAG TPA: hypothetical protein VGL05_19640 [Kribbella sp.]